jgi:formylmethanofuran dehydrogenase subunit B
MALKPISTSCVTKLVCDVCGHIQDEISIPTEHVGEEITYCNIGELQYEQLPVVEYVDEED